MATTTRAGAAIELHSLTKRYGRGKHVLTAVNDVSLRVEPGQVLGLLGPNGAGKTTIIKMIAGLITPSSGSITINGFDVGRQRSGAVRQIGAVLEGSRNVYWPLSAWENLLYFGRLKGLHGSEIKPRAERLLTDLGLWARRRQPVGSFSRGMQQKVAVAAALITDPPIILLDEPTLGLDVEAARIVKDWIANLARDQGKTIVLTTHQLDVAQELSERIAVIRAGQILADLPRADLLSRYAEDRFQVSVAGSLDGLGLVSPEGAEIDIDRDSTVWTLPDADVTALYRFLDRLKEVGAVLTSVHRSQPNLEDVFLRLIHEAQAPVGMADSPGARTA
jgi:ABC-2 type transport system ATP-binding protein